ncbi:MAG: hypothetical protein COA83_09655 [Methylophaga sp.]|nr:MAG: hypothetical protein COA83_09655 [Methylophaga sp.]
MADGVFNIAKGGVAEKIRGGATNLTVVLLSVAEVDASLSDYADMAALLVASNTEATFTNYARKTGITGIIAVDNTNERVDCSCADQTWLTAGGAINNTLVKAIVCYSQGAGDANLIPLTYHDFTPTTDASDLTVKFAAAGFYRAS